jgi:hypothetical protein
MLMQTKTANVDLLGTLQAQIAELESQAEAIKNALKDECSLQDVDAKGNQRLDIEGDMFKAVCTSNQRSTVDTKSLYEAFGITEEVLAKYKKPAIAVYTVKVTAR